MTLQKLCDSEMCKSTMRARMRKSGQYVAEIALAGGSELINDCTVTNRKISLLFFILVKLLLNKYFKTCPKHPQVSGLP